MSGFSQRLFGSLSASVGLSPADLQDSRLPFSFRVATLTTTVPPGLLSVICPGYQSFFCVTIWFSRCQVLCMVCLARLDCPQSNYKAVVVPCERKCALDSSLLLGFPVFSAHLGGLLHPFVVPPSVPCTSAPPLGPPMHRSHACSLCFGACSLCPLAFIVLIFTMDMTLNSGPHLRAPSFTHVVPCATHIGAPIYGLRVSSHVGLRVFSECTPHPFMFIRSVFPIGRERCALIVTLGFN